MHRCHSIRIGLPGLTHVVRHVADVGPKLLRLLKNGRVYLFLGRQCLPVSISVVETGDNARVPFGSVSKYI
jgi:hypothetical protein